MSSYKKLMLFSFLPALFLISCALSSISGNKTESKEIKRGVASNKVAFLTYEQIQAMPAKDLFNYYKKLHVFLAEIEHFQYTNKNRSEKTKTSQMMQFIEEAHAAGTETLPPYKLGNECLIGGYWGTWEKKSNGRMTCNSPNRCTLPGGVSGHKCKPEYFSYQNAETGKEFCAPYAKDLTQSSCVATVNQYYSDHGDATAADHFKRSLLKAIEKDARFQGISPSAALLRYKQEILTEYDRIKEYCGGEEEAEWGRRHNAGQNYSCFNLRKQFTAIENAVGDFEKPAKNAEVTRPPEKAELVRGAGLGPFACVKSGLEAAGKSGISDKYIALLALGSKYQADSNVGSRKYQDGAEVAVGGEADARTTRALRNTLRSVYDLGVCKSDYGKGRTYDYADNAERDQVDSWLNRESLTDARPVDSATYNSIFQVRWGTVMPKHIVWDEQSRKMKKYWWTQKAGQPATPPFKCAQVSSVILKKKECEVMFRTCGLEPDCDFTPEVVREGSNNGNHTGGNNNGGHNNGGGNNGHNNGGNDNGNDTGGRETTHDNSPDGDSSADANSSPSNSKK